MTEHQGSSFVHSCVKVPIDPYSRQPTPLYERPRVDRIHKQPSGEKNRRINFSSRETFRKIDDNNSEGSLENVLQFLESIPDYGEINHLSNEQFTRKLDYLKRKQRLLVKNLKNCSNDDDNGAKPIDDRSRSVATAQIDSNKIIDKSWIPESDLKLRGKKCSLEGSRNDSPLLFATGTFAGLAEDQDLLTYRCRDKEKSMKTMRNREIHSAGKSWSTWSESRSTESVDSDSNNSAETRSLPPNSPKRWQPTIPKPFRFALRDDAEKWMSMAETEAEDRSLREISGKNSPAKKRKVRPIPLTSRIPLYDKLMAAKEERSRMVREESAWCLMSQVKPFRLECELRAGKAITRSSPELCTNNVRPAAGFKAKPVPKNLFGTEVYDKMLEDEYYRQLQKKVRAAELLKSASLPPSMARRERIKSAGMQTRNFGNEKQHCFVSDAPEMSTGTTPVASERSRSAMTELSARGSNLTAILRCQASREKLERDFRQRMEEEHRERMIKLRAALISQKPAWRALREAARQEHERDLDFRTCLRRDEAREQRERHRLEMEMMLNRVTQIPTLFERHSQNFQAVRQLQSRATSKTACKTKKKKKRSKRRCCINLESDASPASASRPGSGSLTSSSSNRASASRSCGSTESRKSELSSGKSENSMTKKKNYRGPLRVSINETAELIEDRQDGNENGNPSGKSRRCSDDASDCNEKF